MTSADGGVTVALETSVRAASVAVRVGQRSATSVLEPERAHASDLLPRLERLLDELGVVPASIDVVLVGTGPGSYTGLRVGIATAIGLARGCGAELFALPSLEVLAYGALEPGAEAVVLLDARGAALYFARYRRTADDVEELHPPSALSIDEARALLADDVPILGDLRVGEVARLDAAQRARLVTDAVPRADALLELGAKRARRAGPMRPEEIEPLYLRPFAGTRRRR